MSDQQDRILRLFMEEAKEHLDTLENGLVDLKSTMKDPESLQEMFRAAHSVKGGAAMLGLDSIKTTAHRLEDCFKILKDGPVKQVDQTAESLFLKGVDTLKDLVQRMSGPFGLRNEEGEKLVQQIMPAFAQLETHLNNLVSGKVAGVAGSSGLSGAAPTVSTTNFTASVMVLLKEMLQVFKGKESAATRQQLSDLCVRLYKLGTGIESWQSLVKTARVAIANPKNSYKVLAPLIIKELKDAGDLVQGGKVKAIAPSKNLLLLAAPPQVAASVPATAPASESIALPAEPKAVVKLLLKTFNKKQLSEIAKLLIHAIKSAP
ncbi:MAG: histidine kinase [Oscillatoriales cyanobacterium]|uniref:Hpt domain-containing protein n=1 Tax=Microcoleus anatoxicus PTRS2 TaxID=2705321 RepID=A0ABU8YRC6_9CYAN|nr:MAG: histidine kinase [Oscillatoriales cyanobacterium]TAD93667.1 MAG: histidine kinase [Oscillatoriales cyanobacterium]TAE01394.1 MAG: histidine kinase [Oscillatoriales cyanobacterium]TAF01648.1 MAG: histidine kinase [Oscillatoriales cyanobacterium]TAF62504.1 MAG: histidine kinase [Oscillatoriales cyanobacterium]